MSEESNRVKISHIERDVEKNATHIEVISNTINGVQLALERISYTLEKIEKVEKENSGLKKEISKLRYEIQEIKSFNNKVVGAVIVVVFLIEILAKFI